MDRAAKRRMGRAGRRIGLATSLSTSEMLEQRVLLSSSADPTASSTAVFIKNVGQWDPSIRYALRGQGSNVLMTDSGPIFQVYDAASSSGKQFYAEFDRANSVAPSGLDKSSAKFNFYVGDSSTWKTGVAGYNQIAYTGLYDGIDLHTWGKNDSLKYEFHVAAGADYSQIAVSYHGIKGLSIDSSGKLHVNSGFGELVDDAPFVYQIINGKRVGVKASFKLIDNDTYTFSVTGKYDKSKELIIDPSIDWSSYIGGTGADSANAITVSSGDLSFVTGSTGGVGLDVTGGFDTTFGGQTDAFVSQYQITGQLVYTTFYGGSGNDVGNALVSDGTSVYVTGTTDSTDLDVLGGFDNTYGGGTDVFVLKMTRTGLFTWGSYLGGAGDDRGMGIDIAGTGNLFVTGDTGSDDFPTTANLDQSRNGIDAFVTSIVNPATVVAPAIQTPPSIAWSTFIGGEGTDTANGITIRTPAVSIVGTTTSTTGLATNGAYDTSFNGGTDVFVTTLDVTAGTITRSTYVGGSGNDEGTAIDVDGTGQLWFTGSTDSTDYPLGTGFDSIYHGGGDAFVTTLGATGAFVFSSFIGGAASDQGNSINIAPDGNVLVAGTTSSTDLLQLNPIQTGYGGGVSDGFILSVTPLNILNYESFIGGNGADAVLGVDAQSTGQAVVVGSTESTDLLVTGPDTTLGGTSDGFISHISPLSTVLFPLAPSNLHAVAVSMSRIDLTWVDNATNELGFEVRRKTGANGVYDTVATLPPNSHKYSDLNLTPSTTYFYTIRAFNRASFADSNEASATTRTAGLHAPTGLVATAFSSTRIDLRWKDNSDNESSFEIWRQPTALGGVWTLIGSAPANATSFHDQSGLTPATQYAYRIRAVNQYRTSTFTSPVIISTRDTSFVVAPSGLVATVRSGGAVSLSWQDNSNNETGFSIERADVNSDSFAEIATTGSNSRKFVDQTAAADQVYIYRVRAFSALNFSEYSNEATSNLEVALAKPSLVEALTVASNQMKLTWRDNSFIEKTFIIERAIRAPSGFRVIARLPAETTTYYDKTVVAGQRYYYRIRVTDGTNFSGYSNNATDRVLPVGVIPPAQPTVLRATVQGTSSVRLSWHDNANGETNYAVERTGTLNGPFTRVATLDMNTTRYTDTTVGAGKTYYYRVRSLVGNFRSAPSGIVSATTVLPQKLSISMLEPQSSEPDGQIVYLVRRKNGTDGNLFVHYKVSGTATNGVDYQTLSGTVLIPDGDPTAQIRAFIKDDSIAEPTETITLTLVNGAGYRVSPSTNVATGQILDNDSATPSSLTSAGQSIFSKSKIGSTDKLSIDDLLATL